MTLPKRLLDEGATDFERALLRSVVSERPSPRLRVRMLQGLGITGLGLLAARARAAAASTAGKVGVAFVTAGALSALVTPPVVASLEPRAPEPALAATNDAPSPTLAEASPEPAVVEARVVDLPEPAAPAELVARRSAEGELRAQIELLDLVKAALAQRDPTRARSLLERFEREFPSGVLLPEARTLARRAGRHR